MATAYVIMRHRGNETKTVAVRLDGFEARVLQADLDYRASHGTTYTYEPFDTDDYPNNDD